MATESAPCASMNCKICLATSGSLRTSPVATFQSAQPRHGRGFQTLGDWNGTGVITDRRWRGGRSRRKKIAALDGDPVIGVVWTAGPPIQSFAASPPIQPRATLAVPSYRHLFDVGSTPMDMKLPDRACALLWPTAPSAGLARLAGRPKSTAHSWRSSHRRTPLDVLRLLRRELQTDSSVRSPLGDL
jgi:hypothetical protein